MSQKYIKVDPKLSHVVVKCCPYDSSVMPCVGDIVPEWSHVVSILFTCVSDFDLVEVTIIA